MLSWIWLASKSKSNRDTCSYAQVSRSLSPIAWSSSRGSGSEQTATWLVSKSRITSSLHLHFSMLLQQLATGEGGKRCWGILQIFSHPTLETTSKVPAHKKSAFSAGKWSPKPYSMSPLVWDPKVIVVGTSKHTFWDYSNLKSA